MSLVLQVFSHKPKYWTNYSFDLMMALDEKSPGLSSSAIIWLKFYVITIHPEGDMSVCTKWQFKSVFNYFGCFFEAVFVCINKTISTDGQTGRLCPSMTVGTSL